MKKIDNAIGEAFKPQPALPRELRKTTNAMAIELADMAEKSARDALSVSMNSQRKLDFRRAGMQLAEMEDAAYQGQDQGGYQVNALAEEVMKPLGAASLTQEAHEFLRAQDPNEYQQFLDELQQGEKA